MNTEIQKTSDFQSFIIPTEEEDQTVNEMEDLPFLPNIKLIQAMSKEREGDPPLASEGDFFIPAKNLNVGKEVEIVIAGRRTHALLLDGAKKVKETFDYSSKTYEQIAYTKDDRDEGIVAFSGKGDWLFFLPQHDLFVTYFCGKRSSRPLTNEILDHFTDPKDRKTELAREKPHTDHFTLFSHYETKAWGEKFKCQVPKIIPLDKFTGDFNPAAKEHAQKTFYAPVLKEREKVEIKEEDR